MAEVARLYPVNEPDEAQDTAAENNAVELLLGEAMRIAEALVFAATEPLAETEIAKRLPGGVTAAAVMAKLREDYAARGVNLVRVGRSWTFRTAADLGWLLAPAGAEQKKLSRPAMETLAIVAYHQPVTRAEIEDIRGVAISKGTLDVLIETGWVRLRGRRKTPGRPITYGTTPAFLLHYGLESVADLPGLDELKGAGLFEGRLPEGFSVPQPSDSLEFAEDEDPLEDAADLDAAMAMSGVDPQTEMAEPAFLAEEDEDAADAGKDNPED